MKFIETIGKESYSENVFRMVRYINLDKVYAFRLHIFDKSVDGWVALQLDIYDDGLNSDAVITYRVETYDTVKEAVTAKLRILDHINREGVYLIESL